MGASVSAGDLLSEARNSGDETGKMIDHYIKEGQIVPVEVTVAADQEAPSSQGLTKGKHLFLVDGGFPSGRNADKAFPENLEGWYRVMGSYCTVEFVLFFDCPESVMEERLLQAWADEWEDGRQPGEHQEAVPHVPGEHTAHHRSLCEGG